MTNYPDQYIIEGGDIDTGDAMEQGARIRGKQAKRDAITQATHAAQDIRGVARKLANYRVLDGGCDGAYVYFPHDFRHALGKAFDKVRGMDFDTQCALIGVIAELDPENAQDIRSAWREAMDFYLSQTAKDDDD